LDEPRLSPQFSAANAAIDRWSAAYSANDVEAVVKNYWPDAILLGTNSPVISTGTDEIRKYFTDLKLQASGNKNTIQDRHTIPSDKSRAGNRTLL
jgi:ketosteroid isomerase-like protein